MWYKQSKKTVEAADAWDVLSSPAFEWQGSFKETLKNYSFNDPEQMPTVYTMAKLVKYVTQINYLKMAEKNLTSYVSDLHFFGNCIVKFVDQHLKKIGSADSETFIILDYLGKITELLKANTSRSVTIGPESSSVSSMKYGMQNLLSIGFKTLNLLNSRGVEINNSALMYMFRNEDVKLGANPENDDRKEILQAAVKNKPYLNFFMSHNYLINYINTTDIDKNTLNNITPFIKSYAKSGLSNENFCSLIESIIGVLPDNEIIDMLLSTDSPKKIESYLMLDTTMPNGHHLIDEFIKNIINYAQDWDMTKNLYEKLRQNRNFKLHCEKLGSNIREMWLFNGFPTVETMLKYLEQNPENLKEFSPEALALLPNLASLQQKSIEAKTVILANGLDVIDKAIKEKVINKIDPFEKTWNLDFDPNIRTKYPSYNLSDFEKREIEIQNSASQIFTNFQQSYLDRMEQERQFTTVSKEDVAKYAEKLIILEFDTPRLKEFLNQNNIKKLEINGVDFLKEDWGGLFVPRFPTKSDELVPAILIKTNNYDSLEHHKELAKNLGISNNKFTEGTRRHEIAHALHYLAAGDVIATPSELMNPEVTKEEAYLLNPSEMYARTHGDIPYLSEIFRNRLSQMMVSKQVYEAAKEQWLQDIVNQKIHLMSGGTNIRRLLMEDETPEFKKENFGKIIKKDGTEIVLPDPQGAVLKILERQRAKLEMIFHQTFTVAGKRDLRIGLIKKKNRIKKELESMGDTSYSKKIDLENDLKKVEEDLIKSGPMMIFDVSDVSDAVLEGYLKDYFGKVSEAVANGLLSSDILNQDDHERAKQQKADDESEPQKPRADDIAEITRSLVDYSQKIPGGRKFDTLMPVYIGRDVPQDSWTWKQGENPNDPNKTTRPKGNYPGIEPTKSSPGANISFEKDKDNTDPFVGNKKASGYNFRRLIK